MNFYEKELRAMFERDHIIKDGGLYRYGGAGAAAATFHGHRP